MEVAPLTLSLLSVLFFEIRVWQLWKKGTGSRLDMDTLNDVFAGSHH